MVNNMQVGSLMPGFVMWTTPQHDMYGFGAVGNTPGQMFDQQRMVATPPLEPLSPPDVDVVQETQPQEVAAGTSKRKGNQALEEPREKSIQQPWSPEEQMALARAWLEVTEDPKEANYQKEKTYWLRITRIFLRLINKDEGYRQHDSVCSKWWKIRASIQAYNEIYTRLNLHHQSGSNDADLQSRALQEYNVTHPAFVYLREWEYLRKSSKFNVVTDWDPKSTRGEPSAKRSKTTSSADPQSQGSDARVHIDLNTTEEEGETRGDRYIRTRPGGRDAAKKAAHAGSSGKYLEEFDKLGEKLEELIEVGKQRVEMNREKLQLKKEKQLAADLKILATDYSFLSEAERQVAEEMKRRIREKYGFN